MPDLQWNIVWGGSEAQRFGSLYPRLHRRLPTRSILQIAPGYGRWAKFLIGVCRSYVGVGSVGWGHGCEVLAKVTRSRWLRRGIDVADASPTPMGVSAPMRLVAGAGGATLGRSRHHSSGSTVHRKSRTRGVEVQRASFVDSSMQNVLGNRDTGIRHYRKVRETDFEAYRDPAIWILSRDRPGWFGF
jgi:hypothetical protein